MLFDSYWSRIQDLAKLISYLLIDADPIFKILEMYETDLQDLSGSVFSKSQTFLFPKLCNFQRWYFSKMMLHLLYFWNSSVGSKLNIVGLGNHGHVNKSENHEHDSSLRFSRVKSKSYSSKKKQNDSTHFVAYLFLKSIVKVAPETPPPTPQIRIFPDFL